MKPDLVSVVIVAYNNWPDVELAIQSALQQSYQPLEVIVIDNDSSDDTSREVPGHFGHLVRYLRQPNVGDGGGYNTGMRLAEGEFIQFMDGDDFLAPNKIEKQVEVLRSDPKVDIAYGDVRCFQSFPGVPNWKDWDTFQYDNILPTFIDPDERNPGPLVHSVLFRRSALDRVGPWDETQYIVDQDYWLRASWAGCRFRYCPGSLCFYRRYPSQMSANVRAMASGTEAVWEKALTYITQEPYHSALAIRLARHRYRMAVVKDGMTVREALAKLSMARSTNRPTISALAYAIAVALIIIPGLSFLVRAPGLRLFRRGVVKCLDLS